MIESILSAIFALVGTIAVILLTYFASKWYAKRFSAMASGKHIKVLDKLPVSKTGAIMIIDVEGSQYVVGVSENNIQILKELDESIPLPIEHNPLPIKESFQSFVDRYRK